MQEIYSIHILNNNSNKPYIYFDVENPFFSITSLMISVSVILFFILLIVLAIGIMTVNMMEIIIFILISGIVILPIIGLIFTDTPVGPNSPFGIVLKHPPVEVKKGNLTSTTEIIDGGQGS